MISTQAIFRLLAAILLAGLLAGCASPTPAPTSTAAPTVNLQPTFNAIQTQAVQTVIANLTKTAPSATPVTPTATLPPTATPTLTRTLPPPATATATYIPWTLTPTQASYSCSVTDFSPKSSDSVAVSGNFDARWVVKNTGKEKWLSQETDIRYVSGTKMQKKGDIVDLSTDVAPNDSYTVIVDMTAPSSAGTYTATWHLITGKNVICLLNVSVVVK